MDNIKISHDEDVKNVSLDLDGIGISEIKDDISFSIDTNSTPNITEINLDTKTINLDNDKSSKDIDVGVGLDLLANPKKTMRTDSSDDEADRNIIGEKEKPNNDIKIDTPKIESFNLESVLLNDINDKNEKKTEVEELTINDLFGSTSDNKLEEITINDIDLDIKPSNNFESVNISSLNDNNENKPSINLDTISLDNFPPPVEKVKTLEDIQKDKREYLLKFDRIRTKGVNMEKHFNMNSDINDMKNEYERITYSKKVENSVKMQRQWLLAFTTGIEMLNKKFDPFDVKLDGWSESMSEGVNDYDEVFEELYEKYKEKAEVAPELKLLLMVGGSAFMFHITNSMFKSSLPGMEQIIKQNPDLMKSFADAAVQQMGQSNPGVANFMGAYGPNSNSNQSSMYDNSQSMDYQSNNYGGTPFNQGTQSYERKEMTGPSNMDDILGEVGIGNTLHRPNSMSTTSAQDLSDIRSINLDIYKKKPKRDLGITLDL